MTATQKNRPNSSEETADAVENATKKNDAKAAPGFPIVGIGASAGGLAAFEKFFSAMPADIGSDMAFVLVQHLAPDHKSLLTELIARYTRMKVLEAEDGMIVKANCVYIIPPNREMALLNGTLQLLEPRAPRGHRLPIDFFFRSLAQDQSDWAIGIVLSGNGSDGTMGVRDIKGEGGMVIAQKPESTPNDSMPRSAIATGLVDYVLIPSEMPAVLINYVKHAYITHAYTTHAFTKDSRPAYAYPPNTEEALKKIFLLLRAQTGHDFSQYKFSTINRRISRRMSFQKIEMMEEYVRYLQQTPAEVEALFHDFLIGVTSFFRDSEAFAVLQEIGVPQLFADRNDGDTIRVWVPGCSTGEEAYSIAILLQEYIMTHEKKYELQMFATDIDIKAIEYARAGIYPLRCVADISPERLSRFFTQDADGGGYRARNEIRDMVLFSEQDLVSDPSFSRIDLISCRNLLIYMKADLNKKIINRFHYSLNPGGLLFLGNSESLGRNRRLFSSLDGRAKMYLRKDPGYQTGNLEALKQIPTQTENFSAHRIVRHRSANADIAISDKERKITKVEMQLIQEELETCKEELQSVNEELVAVNGELQAKLIELYRANNDMKNIWSVTGVGIIVVDPKLHIQRFTPAISKIIHLVPTDIGRPIGHIRTKLVEYESLAEDIQAVLDEQTSREVEVRTRSGRWFQLRLHPYRTLENVVDGVVVSFFDIIEKKQAKQRCGKKK